MSRNARQKAPSTPKVKRRRRVSDTSSSSLDLSDDGGYSGVDDVSDSEDNDEEDVEAAEAEHIIDRALHNKHPVLPPRPVPESDDDGDDEEAVYDDENDEDDEADADDNDNDNDNDNEDVDDNSSWNGILSDVEDNTILNHGFVPKEPPVVERHVRFAGVPDSDTDSTTSDVSDHGDFFPDIFVEQTSLDPAFRREIEDDRDDSSNSGSFWDFHEAYETAFNSPGLVKNVSDDDTPLATPAASRVISEASTPVPDDYQDLDGYETDGDTTEEDVPDPPIRRKQPVRRVQTVEVSSDSDTEKPAKPRRRGKPRVGRFDLDSSGTKPIAVVNPISRKMMIFTPQRLRRLDLSPESFNLDMFNNPSMLQASPILSNSGTLMFGAMFSSNTFGDFMNTQPVGPAEAFFSATSDAFADDSDSEVDASEEDDAEKSLKIEDFVTFEETSSGDEGEGEGDGGDTNAWEDDTNDGVMSTPGRRPSTAASAVSDANPDIHPLFAHFDSNSDAVGAFRRNQVNQQLILSDKATKESLLFSNAYSMGTIRGVRSDSLSNLAAPLTPARRRKNTMDMHSNLQSSPLENMSQKRKASSSMTEASHKRHRSISDVQSLQI
ncbi:hypothetical protein RB598_005550 [Gaeumannomyces tritici]